MNFFKIFTLASLLLSANIASAYGLMCTTNGPEMDYLTLDRDGGEETVSVHYLNEQQERFLVLQNSQGKIVAVADPDLNPERQGSGVMMILNEANGFGRLALNGQILVVSCKAK